MLVVSVPVLSVHTVFTRARPSMATSSLTSALYWPSRITPAAKAMEVISTRPSGIIGTIAAAIDRIDSRRPVPERTSCVQIVRMPVGISSQVITLRMLLMPLIRIESVSENSLASLASLAA